MEGDYWAFIWGKSVPGAFVIVLNFNLTMGIQLIVIQLSQWLLQQDMFFIPLKGRSIGVIKNR